MNAAHSNWTGRTRRTMAEAFGPYTSNQLEPMPEADSVTDVALALVLACVAAVALTVLAIVLWGFV